MRKVFLDELPRKKWGDKEYIDWKNSIGYIVKFIYDDIDGEFEIIDKVYKDNLMIKYKNTIKKIQIESIKLGLLGAMLGKITSNFRVEIGTVFKDNKRDLVIIDRDYRYNNSNKTKRRWYKYRCNVCGYKDGWVDEDGILREVGCACCANKIVIEGINDIPTTAPWMIPYFQNGYEDAKLHSHSQATKFYPRCPDCGKIKQTKICIYTLYDQHSIGCTCSDGRSYPEKFVASILDQLKLDYITELSKTTFDWCDKYRYDFYIKQLNCIIETHGRQHYKESSGIYKKTLEQEQENDKLKEQLAKENGIEHYIVLDCRYSKIEWIKKSVLESELPTLLNFKEEDIDWKKVEEHSLSNLVKEACEYWNNNENITTSQLGKILDVHSDTIVRYLKKGTKIGWCNYISKVGRKPKM